MIHANKTVVKSKVEQNQSISLNKMTLEDIDVTGKRVLLRCDFNVPVQDGIVINDARIVAVLPTIRYLLDHNARVILCSHFGRPKGEVRPEFSLRPVAVRLSKLLGRGVSMAMDVVGTDAQEKAAALQDGEILLLENVRFHKEEAENDPAFAQSLAALAEIFVNDAFGTAHRNHASTTGVADYLPAVCGYLIQKEIRDMGTALEKPKRPFVLILGGSKVSDKIGVIDNLLGKVDTLIIGGAMAYTFFRAKGWPVGASLCEEDKVAVAAQILQTAEDQGVRLLLPIDNRVADCFDNDADSKVVDSQSIPDGWMGLDIGPKTCALYVSALENAGTIIWNGPMGVFEMPNFSGGTSAVAKAVADSNATTIVGGGDSAAAIIQMGYADKVSHISTGGGASLKFLEGGTLPAIAALDVKH
jgi:3-phosphoglycerate kinase